MRLKLLVVLALLAMPSAASAYPLPGDPGDPNERRVGTMTISGIYQAGTLKNLFVMDIYGFSGGVTRPTGGSGRFDNFTVIKQLDRASPTLMVRAAAATRNDKVFVTVYRPGTTTPLVTYCLGYAFLTSIRPWDHGVVDDGPLEELSFGSVAEIKQTNYNADGSVATAATVSIGTTASPC
jgi:type VI protein secretion system component Hcp